MGIVQLVNGLIASFQAIVLKIDSIATPATSLGLLEDQIEALLDGVIAMLS